jgi:hypothetical protein
MRAVILALSCWLDTRSGLEREQRALRCRQCASVIKTGARSACSTLSVNSEDGRGFSSHCTCPSRMRIECPYQLSRL